MYEDISLRKHVGFLKALLIRLISINPPFHSLRLLGKSLEMTFPLDTMIAGLNLIFEVLPLMLQDYESCWSERILWNVILLYIVQ